MAEETFDKEPVIYEITYTQITEDAAKMRQVLQKHAVQTVSERPLVKIHLSYPIEKQAYAFMGSVRFSTAGSIDALSKDMTLDGGALRFMIHKVDIKTEEAVRKAQAERSMAPRPFVKKGVEPSLTNEALEKKIEEILK